MPPSTLTRLAVDWLGHVCLITHAAGRADGTVGLRKFVIVHADVTAERHCCSGRAVVTTGARVAFYIVYGFGLRCTACAHISGENKTVLHAVTIEWNLLYINILNVKLLLLNGTFFT